MTHNILSIPTPFAGNILNCNRYCFWFFFSNFRYQATFFFKHKKCDCKEMLSSFDYDAVTLVANSLYLLMKKVQFLNDVIQTCELKRIKWKSSFEWKRHPNSIYFLIMENDMQTISWKKSISNWTQIYNSEWKVAEKTIWNNKMWMWISCVAYPNPFTTN